MKRLILLCVLIIFNVLSSEAIKLPQVCPDCAFSPQDSFKEFAMRYIEGNGPSDGICQSGAKVIHYGKDYNMPKNACCCLHSPATAPIVCGPESPQCPQALIVGTDETAEHYCRRTGKHLKGAPANGCCQSGTYKWFFGKETTGATEDICACLKPNKIADPNVNWREPTISSSSSSSAEN